MSTYQTLDCSIEDQVAWITLNRPDAFNAIGLQSTKDLCDVVTRLGGDRGVRAVVITGSGEKAFCAGGDIAGFHANLDDMRSVIAEMTLYLHTAMSRLAWMPAPVIAAVNGVAAGAGLSLMAGCDLAIAADSARFTSAYTQIGLTPDGSSTYFLPRIIGRRRALELYLTNRRLTAEEALDWGLVNRIVPAKDLRTEVQSLAKQLAEGPTRAHGGVKKMVLMAFNDTLESQMELESRTIIEMSATADGREGVQAFVQKRKPAFRGE